MLANASVIAFVATQDPERARAFYETVLGLTFVADEAFALVFDCHGIMLRIAKVSEVNPQPHTVLGWQVADIEAEIAQLADRGVAFESYQIEGEPQQAIVTFPDGARVAWFKDPDGNILSLTELGPNVPGRVAASAQ